MKPILLTLLLATAATAQTNWNPQVSDKVICEWHGYEGVVATVDGDKYGSCQSCIQLHVKPPGPPGWYDLFWFEPYDGRAMTNGMAMTNIHAAMAVVDSMPEQRPSFIYKFSDVEGQLTLEFTNSVTDEAVFYHKDDDCNTYEATVTTSNYFALLVWKGRTNRVDLDTNVLPITAKTNVIGTCRSFIIVTPSETTGRRQMTTKRKIVTE